MENLKTAGYFFLLFLRWAPRILCILFALFLTLFSFDVFGQHAGLWKTLVGFLIQNIPVFVIIVILALSWKWPWIGGICYIALGIFYFSWEAQQIKYPIIGIPPFIIGVLFLLNWFFRKETEKAREAYWGDN